MSLLRDCILISRINKPIGIWLIMFPGLSGLARNFSQISLGQWLAFIIGAIVMRSAGCIYNDIVDRPFDAQVARTRSRPLVRRENPMSVWAAYSLLTVLLVIGLACLLTLNLNAIAIGVGASMMIALYPWMKRITYWPQLFLGFTMNIGFILGVAAVEAPFDLPMLWMYLGMVIWTLGYDTIYGFQDMEDDGLIGVRSASLKVKKYPRVFIGVCYATAKLGWMTAVVSWGGSKVAFITIFISKLILMWQAATLKTNIPENCLRRFKANQWISILIFFMVLFGSLKH